MPLEDVLPHVLPAKNAELATQILEDHGVVRRATNRQSPKVVNVNLLRNKWRDLYVRLVMAGTIPDNDNPEPAHKLV